MMKKREDSGFTLIELMIVIAVIGILAIVLVPKVGTVKAQAKETGLDVNVRLVQGYAESKINKWTSNPTVTTTDVQNDIVSAFSGNKALTNPITSDTDDAGIGDGTTEAFANQPVYVFTDNNVPDDDANLQGTVLVHVTGSYQVDIYAYDENGNQITEKTVSVTP